MISEIKFYNLDNLRSHYHNHCHRRRPSPPALQKTAIVFLQPKTRTEANLSQQAVADKLGKPQSYISRL
ncbi:XRE family transcriptional regulator [Patescibacteria group bacterium]|nr:MAG: XRE family transcriptional regulator [Patescibacteria group bacterium]